jgi:2-oxoglutarate dehydrogenase E1 component
MAGLWRSYRGGSDDQTPEAETAVSEEKLRGYLRKLGEVPEGFTPHDKIEKLLEQRRKLADGPADMQFDWATAEHLAFASLLDQGVPVRLSGQDSRRGTFSQRHAVLADVKTGARFTPLRTLEGLDAAGRRARFDVYDSPLSEAGVLGFDYGMSLDWPDALIAWEAQFGDFANAAQVVIDQFLSSCEDKWLRLNGLVMLLPHGFEGQGPEHSSARLERFLQLCAEDNMQVCYLTTPAQYFHVLRRQVLRPYRKPLVMMTPKSLLRAKGATSSLRELSAGKFERILGDPHVKPDGVKRVLLCSGKVYYDLATYRDAKKREDVAIIRLEQLYPLRDAQLQAALAPYKDGVEVVWVQEEPFNMGGWYYLHARWPEALKRAHPLRCASRPESASPATGSAASHKYEQQLLVEQSFK